MHVAANKWRWSVFLVDSFRQIVIFKIDVSLNQMKDFLWILKR